MHAKIIQKIRLQQKVSKHTAYGYLVFHSVHLISNYQKEKKRQKDNIHKERA